MPQGDAVGLVLAMMDPFGGGGGEKGYIGGGGTLNRGFGEGGWGHGMPGGEKKR